MPELKSAEIKQVKDGYQLTYSTADGHDGSDPYPTFADANAELIRVESADSTVFDTEEKNESPENHDAGDPVAQPEQRVVNQTTTAPEQADHSAQAEKSA